MKLVFIEIRLKDKAMRVPDEQFHHHAAAPKMPIVCVLEEMLIVDVTQHIRLIRWKEHWEIPKAEQRLRLALSNPSSDFQLPDQKIAVVVNDLGRV